MNCDQVNMSKPLQVTVADSVRKQIYLHLYSSQNHHKYLSCYIKFCWLFKHYKLKPALTDIPWLKLTHACEARLSPGIWVRVLADPVNTYQQWKDHWWISLSHTEISFPSGLLHLAAGDEGSLCWIHGLRSRVCCSSSSASDALPRARAGPAGLQWGSSGARSAQGALIPRERVAWGVWGSRNSKQLPGGLPEAVCQLCPSFAPAQSPCTPGPSATGGRGLVPTGTFQMDTFTLLKHYKGREKQCRSVVLKFAHSFKIRSVLHTCAYTCRKFSGRAPTSPHWSAHTKHQFRWALAMRMPFFTCLSRNMVMPKQGILSSLPDCSRI